MLQGHADTSELDDRSTRFDNRQPGDTYQGGHYQTSRKTFSTSTTQLTSRKHHVLVVHYQAETLEMIAALFCKLGYHVTTTSDSAEALWYTSKKEFDLVFSDLDMPQLDGYRLAKLIKMNDSRIKAMVMTCCCQAEIADLMKNGVIDGWIYKPFNSEALSALLAAMRL